MEHRNRTGLMHRVLRNATLRRAVGTLSVAALATTLTLADARPAAAATGEGVGYAASVWCDPYFNTITASARAKAAPGVNAQTIQARFLLERRASNGTWYIDPIGGYSTTQWLEFNHYRNAYGVMQPDASVQLGITVRDNGVYRIWTQYRWYYNGWTAPSTFVPTTSYFIVPYTSWTYSTCNL